MEQQGQVEKGAEDPKCRRKRICRRILYGFLLVSYIQLLSAAVSTLVSFASVDSGVRRFVQHQNTSLVPQGSCILYATNSANGLELGPRAPCGFVLGGQVIILIVVFAWLLYTTAMTAQNKKL